MPAERNRCFQGHRGQGGAGAVCGVREMRRRVPRLRHHNTGGVGMKKRWYDYLWAVSLTYLVLGFFNILFAWLGLSRDPVPPGRGAVRLWVLQCHADLDCAGSDYDGAVQAPKLVRLLPHGDHDPAHLQGQAP